MKRFALLGSLLSVAIAADVTVESVTFNDAEQVAVLDVVNNESFETLHYTFDIYDWKSQNIIDGRRYQNLQTLANVNGVTTFVLNLLKSEVNDICSPQPSQGGNYEGQSFTNSEAALTLKAANRAGVKSLTKVANIYESNAHNLFRARQICTMTELSQVSGVGYHVLRLLKKFVNRESGACYTDADCTTSGNVCRGIPHDGILSTGKCVPYATITGEGSSCSATVSCPTGTFCSGLTMGWIQGNCRADWMAGDFSTPYYIRDINVATETQTFFPVSGLASVPEDVVLTMDASAVTNSQDLKIVISDPNGSTATFWDGSVSTGSIPSTVNIFGSISRDDTINGQWTVTFTNTGSAAGTIKDFSLHLTSRWD